MCDYCDCREIPEIHELSDEHEHIRDLVDRLRRGVGSGEEPAAAAVLAELQAALEPHLVREERGLFVELADGGAERELNALVGDHARARAGLLSREPAVPGWSAGITGDLDELVAHIELEEYDVFPASRLLLDDAAWARVHDAVADLDAPAGAPHA